MPKGYPANGVKRKASSANRCAICRHSERARIEALHCAGVSLERLAEKFEVHKDAVWRHMQRHVSEERKASYLIGPAKIAALAEVAAEESESILDYLNILRWSFFALLDKRAAEGDHYAVSMLSSRATEVLREIGKLTGQISNLAEFDGYQRPEQHHDPELAAVRGFAGWAVARLRCASRGAGRCCGVVP